MEPVIPLARLKIPADINCKSSLRTWDAEGKNSMYSHRNQRCAEETREDLPSRQTPLHMLRLKDVCRVTRLCRSMIYQLEQERRFPARIKLTDHAVARIEHEVQEWLADRISTSRNRLGK